MKTMFMHQSKQWLLVVLLVLVWQFSASAQVTIYNSTGAVITADQTITIRSGEYAYVYYSGSASSYAWVKNDDSSVSNGSYLFTNADGLYQLVLNGSQRSVYFTVSHQTVSQAQNYAVTETVRAEGIKSEAQLNNISVVSDITQQVIYSDGLGRPLQEITVASAPNTQKDLVQPYVYGTQGTQNRAYLPFTLGSSGEFKQNWQGEQNSFYQWSSDKVGRPGNGPAYAEKVVDNDPLGRLQEQAAPGESWKLSSGHTSYQLQRSNSAAGSSGDGVQLWTYTPNATRGRMGTVGWQPAADRTLGVTETTDEDGKIQVSYINERGLTVCSRVYLNGRPLVSSSTTKFLETNYVYNDQGKLLATIPPEATKKLLQGVSGTEAFLAQYLFVNEYDGQDRVIASKVPGQAWTYRVYDRWDRLAATQDGNQNRSGLWSFIKYDALNRPIITGQLADARSQDQLTALLTTWPEDRRFEVKANNQAGYSYHITYPEISTVAAADNQIATVLYFDDYGYFPLSQSQRPDLAYEVDFGSISNSTQTRGLLTGSRQRVVSTRYDQWLTSVLYYDEFGRLIQTKRDNHTGSTNLAVVERISSLYDGMSDRVARTFINHKRNNNGVVETHTVSNASYYDVKGRLTTIEQTIDNGDPVALAQYEYNELGQVVDKKLGYDAYEGTWLQSLDYRYNIRGWLTNINNRNLSANQWLDNSTPNSDPDAQPDAFGLELKYESGSQQANYHNGNVSGVIWNSNTPNGRMRQYSYTYDNANRIL